MFLLDTNIIISVMNRRDVTLDLRIQKEITLGSTLIVPAPVLFELRYGATKSHYPTKNHERIDMFLTALGGVANFDDADANEAGEIRAFL